MAEELETLEMKRVKLPKRTLSSLYRKGIMISKMLELPWLNNRRGVSCIPNGKYLVTIEDPIPADDPNTPEDESGGRKARPYVHMRVHNVPGRQGILIHPVGDVKDSLGCMGPGNQFIDYNTDNPKFSYADSKAKLKELVGILPKKFWLNITDK